MIDGEPTIVFQSRGALLEFASAGRWLGSRGVLVLNLPGISEHEQARVQQRLNFWRKVCGCQIGALLMVVTLVWRLLAHKQYWSVNTFVRDVGIAFAMAMIGKVVAIAGARVFLLLDIVSFACRAVAGSAEVDAEIRK